MDLLQWLFRPRKSGYAVLIDGPNVENANFDDNEKLLIAWNSLVFAINIRFTTITPLYARAFSAVYGAERLVAKRWIENASRRWNDQQLGEQERFKLVISKEGDVDPLIADAMGEAVDIALKNGYTELTLVLVSGDHIFAQIFENLRKRHKNKIKLNLCVYSWHDSLSTDLITSAGTDSVILLNTIDKLIRNKIPRKSFVPS
jgi:uncharacterized LabA/DUF88 family protein